MTKFWRKIGKMVKKGRKCFLILYFRRRMDGKSFIRFGQIGRFDL